MKVLVIDIGGNSVNQPVSEPVNLALESTNAVVQ